MARPAGGLLPRRSRSASLPACSCRRPGSAATSRSSAGPGFTVASLVELARTYGAPLASTARRLEELGLLPRGTSDRLEGAVKVTEARKSPGLAAGWREGAARFPARFPARYRALVIRAHEAEALSEGEVAEYLEMDRLDARDLIERAHVVEDGQQLEMSLAESLDAP